MTEALHLVVIGAGLAGLAAAIATKVANPSHKVTILEAVKELQEVGAGLQITPNSTRLLKAWGVCDRLAPLATLPDSLSVRRYDGTKVLAHESKLQETVQQRYGYPFWDLHRVELQRGMVDRCHELGISVRLNSRAVSVDFDEAAVTLEDGAVVSGDVVLCADGMWSSIRSQFLGKPSPAVLTGDLAFRIAIPLDDLSGPHRDELVEFVRGCTVNFWIGPNSHAVSYTVKQGNMLNLGLLSPDNLPEGEVKVQGDLEEMKYLFAGWDPLLCHLLDQVKQVQKWKLCWLEPLDEWTDKRGTFFMAGDCCHPMLPYLAQGANSSLEDGAVLGYLLGKVGHGTKREQLPRVADMYQHLRMDRGKRIQMESFKQRDDFHMPDGDLQRKRDELMLSMLGQDPKPGFPSRWTCPETQAFLYGYDAYAEAEKAYAEHPY